MTSIPKDQVDADVKRVAEDLRKFLKGRFTGLKNTQELRKQMAQETQAFLKREVEHLPDHMKPHIEGIKIDNDGRSMATIVLPQPVNFQVQEFIIPDDIEALTIDDDLDACEKILRRAAEVDWNWD